MKISPFILIAAFLPFILHAATETEKRTQNALALLNSGGAIEKGMEMLMESATEGSDEANYRLGWLFMQPKINSKSDNDIAFDFLNKARGKFEVSAQILIGVIYHQGSKKIPAQPQKAKEIFRNTKITLDRQFLEFKNNVESAGREYASTHLEKSELIRNNYIVLTGFAGKYKIDLEDK